MQRDEQIRVLKQILHRLDEGTNVDAGGIRHNPTWVYTCPELAEKEWQTFYRDYPQVIGASSDLPEPGTFMTTNDFGTPVLASRTAVIFLFTRLQESRSSSSGVGMRWFELS